MERPTWEYTSCGIVSANTTFWSSWPSSTSRTRFGDEQVAGLPELVDFYGTARPNVDFPETAALAQQPGKVVPSCYLSLIDNGH